MCGKTERNEVFVSEAEDKEMRTQVNYEICKCDSCGKEVRIGERFEFDYTPWHVLIIDDVKYDLCSHCCVRIKCLLDCEMRGEKRNGKCEEM